MAATESAPEAALANGRQAARLALVREHVRLENLHDLPGIVGTFGERVRYDDEPWGEHHEGRAGVQAYYAQLFRVAPDLRIEIKREYVTENAVILEVMISGTHVGAWRGLPGTGRRFSFPLCGIYTFDETDKLSGERIYYDRATVLRQVGVFHEPASLMGRLLTPLMHPWTIARALGRTVRSA